MIPTSNAYKQQLIAGNRNYVVKVEMTLADGTSLTLANPQIWEQGVVLNNSISSDDSFEIGTAIIGNLTLVIDNITGFYNAFDFYNAQLVLYMGVTNDLDEHDNQVYYRIGYYVVDEPSYNGSLISLDCLDNMTWFDVPFSEVGGISYPTTAGQVVSAICSHVGVTLGTVTFPNYPTSISAESGAWLSENDVNCREVLQYVAQKCCCYCKINTAGELVLKWYDKTQITGLSNYDGGTYSTTTTPYSDGCDLDGGRYYWNGTQYVWEQGDNADGGYFTTLQEGAWLTNNYEMEVSTDDIVVTGCRVRSTSGDDQYDELWVDSTLELTHERYVLVIENNPLITASEASTVATTIGSTLAGLPIRAFSARSLSDFSIETGDMVTITDFRGNIYYTWITSLTFTINNSENFSCGAESVKKRSETRFSESAKTLAEAKLNANKMLTDYDNAVKAMNELAQDAIGYNIYQYDVNGATVTWLYSGSSIDTTDPEHPTFPNSANVFKISGDGVFISNDGGTTYTQGYDANSGTAILSLIYAVGINCDWIHAGTLTLGGDSNQDGQCSVKDANGVEKVHLDNTGIKVYGGSIEGTSFEQTSGNNIVRISGGVLTTQGTWLKLCKSITNPDAQHLALGYDNSAYIHQSAGYQRTVYSKWIIEAAYNASQGSDKRLKRDIQKLDKELSKNLIDGTKPISFYYKEDDEVTEKMRRGKVYGVIAQEIRETLDDLGETDAYLEHSMYDEQDYRKVEYKEFIPHLINYVQDLQEQVNELKAEVAELKARVK